MSVLAELEVREVRRVLEKSIDEPTGLELIDMDWVDVEFTDGRVITFRPDDPRIRDLKPGGKMNLTTKGIKRVE